MAWVKTEKTGNLNALSDVNISSPSTGEAMVYDQTSGKWINGTVSSVADLDDLTDVEITTPADGDSLIYDAANDKWVNGESSGSNDVVLTQDEYDALTPEEQNNGTNYFISNASVGAQSAAGTPYDNSVSDLLATDVQDAIDELVIEVTNKVDKVNGKGLSTEDYTTAEKTKVSGTPDFNISSPTDGQMLKYDGTSQKWINSGLNLNDLSDVDDYYLFDGYILAYNENNTKWVTREYRNDINIGELYLSNNNFSAPSISMITDSLFSDMFNIRVYDSNGANERIVQPIAYYAETDTSSVWSRDKFYYACKSIISSQVDSMRAYFYFSTGSAIYKITLTANAGDTNFTVGTVTTVSDIFS